MLAKIGRLGAGVSVVVVGLMMAVRVVALESPQKYFDWNMTVAPVRVLSAHDTATAGAEPSPSVGGAASAGDYHQLNQFDYFLGFAASWTPMHPLYFIKRVEERVTLALTFDPVKKEEVRLEMAAQRLAEMRTMVSEGRAEEVADLARSYWQTSQDLARRLAALAEAGQSVAGLAAAEDVEAAKHILVLEEVALQVPPAAQEGVEMAVLASEKVADTVADVVGRSAVPQELVSRLQSLKALGILTEEEVAKLVGADSRVEARKMLREYTDNNIVPAADLRKLDETARYFFPAGYNTVIEIKKFVELKRLETEKPDEATLVKVQEFAKEYKPGEIVPADIRRWFIPMVRLEELQNTIRMDLIDRDWLKYRPEEAQKYEEVVARIMPRPEDIAYVNRLISNNPNLAADPAYMRLKALGDKFGGACPAPLTWVFNSTLPGGGFCGSGAGDIPPEPVAGRVCGQALTSAQSPDGRACATFSTTCIPEEWKVVASCSVERREPGDNSYQACGRGTHWVTIGYMPGGGYCVTNYIYPVEGGGQTERPCPPAYHRNEPGGSCYLDNPAGGTVIGTLPAPGSCRSGYHWVPEPSVPNRGYCSPDYPSGGGGYPGPVMPPSYCPAGTMFRGGKCETYNPAPAEGCGENSWWNGQKCVERKDCGTGQYQDSNGECKSSGDEYNRYTSQCAGRPIPVEGCGAGYWDMASCSCRYTPNPTGGPYPTGGGGGWSGGSNCPMPAGGCGVNSWWDYGSCSCKSSSSYTGGGTSGGSGGGTSCPMPAGGCGTNAWWDYGSCSCRQSSSTTNSTYTSPPTSPTSTSCGSGYYWNGSYCTPSSGGGSGGSSETTTTTSTPSYSPPPPTITTTSTTTTESVPPPSSGPPPAAPPPAEQPPPGDQPPPPAP